MEGLLNRVKKFRISWVSTGMLLSAGIHGWTFALKKYPHGFRVENGRAPPWGTEENQGGCGSGLGRSSHLNQPSGKAMGVCGGTV